MSWFSTVPAGGLYAIAQSAAMGGYGASIAAGTAQTGAVLSSVTAWIWGRDRDRDAATEHTEGEGCERED